MVINATLSLGLFALAWAMICVIAGAVVFEALVPGSFSDLFPKS